jgi:hypothetical protein
VRIALRVHPRFGEEIAIVRAHGPDMVWAEQSDGRLTILPLSWTDLTMQPEPGQVNGRTALLCSKAVLQLSKWVRARIDSAAAPIPCRKLDTQIEQGLGCNLDGSAHTAAVVDERRRDNAVASATDARESGADAAAMVEQARASRP